MTKLWSVPITSEFPYCSDDDINNDDNCHHLLNGYY